MENLIRQAELSSREWEVLYLELAERMGTSRLSVSRRIKSTFGPLKPATVGSNIIVTVDIVSDDNQVDTYAFTLVRSGGKWLVSEWYIDAYRG